MQIDLAQHIERLLFLHDTLVIPGFGGFTATRSPAATDYAGGTVTPPSKTLTFNENLTVDDGILVNDVAQTHRLTLDDARQIVQDFVDRTQTLLNQREIVNLAGVGRLYKNYVQKIQFLPDAANFSADAYGLPPLQFSPIARSREVTESPAESPVSGMAASADAPSNVATPPPAYTPPVYEAPATRSGSPVVVGLVAVLLLICSAAAAYWWLQKKKNAGVTAEKEQTELPTTTVKENVPPPPVANDKPDTVVEQPPSRDEADKTAEESARQKMEEARQQAAKSTTGRRCILIVATLRDQTNVDKLLAKLRANNLTPYHQQTGKGHQVGIEFRYTNAREIQDYKAVLQQLTGVETITVKQK